MLAQKLQSIDANRVTQKPIPSEIAPNISSSSFKLPTAKPKPSAQRWDNFISLEARSRQQATLKALSQHSRSKSLVSLGTARPSATFYPWTAVDFHLPNRQQFDLVDDRSSVKYSCVKGEQNYDLSTALNYGAASGSPQLLRFITEHVELFHDPPYEDWDCSITCGTTSAIDIALRMLCERSDWILSEEYTYPGTVEAMRALGLNVEGIRMDKFGLIPEQLDLAIQVLSQAGRKPKVLYTIPTGQNPTGTTQSNDRRREIYAVADKHDLLIIEDDPYFFIQTNTPSGSSQDEKMMSDRAEKFFKHLPHSYLSLDTSGRVIRIDSTAKILAPGLRVGWITACSQLIDKFKHHTEVSAVAPSGPSQIMLYKLLDEAWGHLGFIEWLSSLSDPIPASSKRSA